MENIDIDFEILKTHNPKSLLVVDTSRWGVVKDKPSIIEITLPGEEVPVVHYFGKERVNVYDSKLLGLTCGECEERIDLPDGIYEVKVKASPDKFYQHRYFLKLDKYRLELDKAIASTDFSCGECVEDKIRRYQKLNLYFEAAESMTRLGKYDEAQEVFFKAQREIIKLTGCKTCV